MAMLVNRNSSRLECLYYILQSAYVKYGKEIEFNMKDLKYNEEDENNTHKFCKLLKKGFVKYCPYLENQFDTSKCYATRSVEFDSTKGKNISDVVRTLEGLGFVSPTQNGKFIITNEGESWVRSQFGTMEWQNLIDCAILSYGPFIGFLYKLRMVNEDVVSPSDIYFGYPNTQETVKVETEQGVRNIELSVGSKKDSVTRQRSKLVSFGLTSGLWVPNNSDDKIESLPHIQHRELLNKERLTVRKIKLTDKVKKVTEKRIYVKHPLSYEHLLKDVSALRENGISIIRRATMKASKKVINRRFIIVDILNRASKNNTVISFKKLFECFKEFSEEFFLDYDSSKWGHIFQSELDIAFLAGIPFEIKRKSSDLEIKPLTVLNDEELRMGTPENLICLADEIWIKVNN